MNNLSKTWLNKRFGKLTVIGFSYDSEKQNNKWVCVCDCGKKIEVYPANARAGRVRSCGCAQIESATTHGMRNTRVYRIWIDMRRRCRDEKHSSYTNYGKRGISVCTDWDGSFEKFYEWASKNGYSDDLTIDRINVNGNYEPDNCRWATAKQQSRNKRNNRYVTVFGETLVLSEAVEKFGNGIKQDTVSRRIKMYGYTPEEAISLKVRERRS